MIIEWVGGPNDGLAFEAPDETQGILIQILDKYCVDPKSIDDLIFHSINVPIRYLNDKWVAIYPNIKKYS